MAQLKPKKIDFSTINGGNEYENNDAVQPNMINGVLSASAYAQALATNPIDSSMIETDAEPKIYIKETSDGTPQIVAVGLKGKTGNSGVSNASLSNNYGESDTDGYTQKATNSLFSNPNILINGDFRINQRGQTNYSHTSSQNNYCVDRWIMRGNLYVDPQANGGIKITSRATTISGVFQSIDNFDYLKGKTVTLSVKISNVNVSSTTRVYIGLSNSNKANAVGTYIGETNLLKPTDGIITHTCTIPQSLEFNRLNAFFAFVHGETTDGDNLVIEWAKLEISPVSTAFKPKTYQEELSDCEYYFKRLYSKDASDKPVFAQGTVYSSSVSYFLLPYSLRIKPTLIYSGNIMILTNGGYNSINSIIVTSATNSTITLNVNCTMASDKLGNSALLMGNEDASAHVDFDAEIY
jgi:hypothetical protein